MAFSGEFGGLGRELAFFDGTEILRADLAPGDVGSSPEGLFASGARLFFAADDDSDDDGEANRYSLFGADAENGIVKLAPVSDTSGSGRTVSAAGGPETRVSRAVHPDGARGVNVHAEP